MTTTRVGNLKDLYAALSAAQSGDTILLEGGDYGDVLLDAGAGLFPGLLDGVTIASADTSDPAVFSSLTLSEIEGLTFESVHVDASDASDEAPAIELSDSTDITIRNSTFYGDTETGLATDADGFAEGYGISLTAGSTLTVEDNLLSAGPDAATQALPDHSTAAAETSAPDYDVPEGAIVVDSIEALYAALDAANGGETILLAPGEYAWLGLNGRNSKASFASEVTIGSADPDNPAQILGMGIRNAQNITIDGVVFDYVFDDSHAKNHRQFQILNSSDITITNSTFDGDVASGKGAVSDGYGWSYALSVMYSQGVNVVDNEFYDFARGVMARNVQDYVVSGNDIHDIRSDGLDFTNVQNVLIENNYLHDFSRSELAGDHPDMIQFWTNQTTSPSTDIVIRGNLLDIGDGDWTQSIFMRNEEVDTGRAGAEMYYQNVLIEENVIINSHVNGITVGETDGLVIRNNTLLHADGANVDGTDSSVEIPQINVSSQAENVVVTLNITEDITGWSGQPDWTVMQNIFAQDQNPLVSGYYGDLFVSSSLQPNEDGVTIPVALPGSLVDLLGAGASVTFDSESDATHTLFQISTDPDNAAVRVFDATVLGTEMPEGTVYTWKFDDGRTVTGPVVSQHYSDGGVYGVQLTVSIPTESGFTVATRSVEVAVESPTVLALGEDGFTAYDCGDVHSLSRAEVSDGKLELTGDGCTTMIGASFVRGVLSAENFAMSMTLKGAENYSGGEIFRIQGSLSVIGTWDGEVRVRANLQDGSQLDFRTSGAGLTDSEAHDIVIGQNDGMLTISVDGVLMQQAEMPTDLISGSGGLYFGSNWSRNNFEGTLESFELSVDAEDYAASPELLGDEVEVTTVPETELPLVEVPLEGGENEVTEEGDATEDDFMVTNDDIGVDVDMSGEGLIARLPRSDVSEILGSDSFDINFDLRALNAESNGEVFRLHCSIIVNVTQAGELYVRAYTEGREITKIKTDGLDLLDTEAHAISIGYEDGTLTLTVDGEEAASAALPGPLQSEGRHDLYFGNPWNQHNFQGEVWDFGVSVEDTDAAEEIAASSTEEAVVEVVEEQVVEDYAAQYDQFDDLQQDTALAI